MTLYIMGWVESCGTASSQTICEKGDGFSFTVCRRNPCRTRWNGKRELYTQMVVYPPRAVGFFLSLSVIITWLVRWLRPEGIMCDDVECRWIPVTPCHATSRHVTSQERVCFPLFGSYSLITAFQLTTGLLIHLACLWWSLAVRISP